MTTTTTKTYIITLRLHGQDMVLGKWKSDSPANACVKCMEEFASIPDLNITATEAE